MATETLISKDKLTILTMIETIRVSSKGQIVIPEALRNKFHIKEGTKLILREQENSILLEVEETFLQRLEKDQERLGWYLLAEKNLAKIWDNPQDEKLWKTYL